MVPHVGVRSGSFESHIQRGYPQSGLPVVRRNVNICERIILDLTNYRSDEW